MENFRILLDLSELEDRVHKFVWMLISTIDLKYVADLKKSVINKLALNRNDIKMFINGGLLLEEEKIMILRENDIVQIQYEKLSGSVCHSSSYNEMLDNKLSSNIEEYNGGEIVKHSKKNKRKSKEVSLEVANGSIEKDLSECKRKRDLAIVDKLEVGNENIKEEEYNGNGVVKHSKKHKRKSKEVSLEIANANMEADLNKHKRKIDMVDKLESCEDEMLIQVESRNEKKHKKSFSPTSAKDVIIQKEKSNIEEMDTIPAPVDAITYEESLEKSRKIEENSNRKSSDIAVDSFIQGSNCKKRKRKRSRKKTKIEPNLMGPFMSANKNSLQKLTEIGPPIFNLCDNFAGIRKHIRFTSPTPESNNEEIETVDLKTNCSDAQEQISPNKTCVSPNPKPLSFPTRKMYIDHANQIANKVYSKTSPSFENTCTVSNTENSSLTTSMSYVDHVNKSSPKLSSKTCIELNSPTLLVSASLKFANYTKPELSSTSNQKSLPQNSATSSPMLKEIKNKSSPVVSVSKSKECKPLKPVIPPYAECTPLNSLPPTGTHVAFKLLELDENYSPQISQYKEGVIKSINPKSEEIEIQLIKAEVKPGRTGKFENLNEDEVPSEEVVKMVSASWASLIEPRLISLG